jgi:hypothetical protein
MEGVVMKSKLLGLMAPILLFGLSPANATAFTYNVSFAISASHTVTGTMVTDCDSCTLGSTDFGAWSFNLPGIGTISGSVPTTVDLPTDLTASPTGLFYNGTACGGPVTFNGAAGGLNIECGFIADYVGIGSSGDTDFLDLGGNSSFEFATIASTTPLPAALPLFAGGLGLLGMFARRRKQKASAIAAV